jgi:hypothetical protein
MLGIVFVPSYDYNACTAWKAKFFPLSQAGATKKEAALPDKFQVFCPFPSSCREKRSSIARHSRSSPC